jgi:hypothetical protein
MATVHTHFSAVVLVRAFSRARASSGPAGRFLEVCLGQRPELGEPSVGEDDPHDAFAARARAAPDSPSATALEREVEPGAEVVGPINRPPTGASYLAWLKNTTMPSAEMLANAMHINALGFGSSRNDRPMPTANHFTQ